MRMIRKCQPVVCLDYIQPMTIPIPCDKECAFLHLSSTIHYSCISDRNFNHSTSLSYWCANFHIGGSLTLNQTNYSMNIIYVISSSRLPFDTFCHGGGNRTKSLFFLQSLLRAVVCVLVSGSALRFRINIVYICVMPRLFCVSTCSSNRQ